MLIRPDIVRHEFPLQATYFRQVLPHVRGIPTLRVLRLIRLPIGLQQAFPLSQYFSAYLHHIPVRPLGSGITLCPGFPLRASISVYPTTAFPQPGAYGASQVLRRISSCMPQPEDSGGLPHPRLDGCFLLASEYVKTLAVRNTYFEAVPALRARGCPYGLQDSLCTLHLLCSPA